MKKINLTHDLVEAISRCVCPRCGKKLDGRTQVEEGGISTFTDGKHPIPKAGDVSICLYCRCRLVFIGNEDGYLRLRPMAEMEYEGLPGETKDALNVDLSTVAKQEENPTARFMRDLMNGWKR